jgi:polysaccharide export outer membrane protein
MHFNKTSAFWLFSTLLLLGILESATAQSRKRRDDITYFQDLAPSDTAMRIGVGINGTAVAGYGASAAAASSPYVYRLQAGDILAIAVSSLNAEADQTFNPFARTGFNLAQGGNNSQDNNNLPIGYRVSETGTINFPKHGAIKVVGKTLSGLEDTLRTILLRDLKEPFVSARLLNFKISVMGEVNRPSIYTVQNEKITLTEAISLAGDLTVYGKRDNVMVIRETTGQREFIRVDLTQRNTFTSAAYYLKPNDVIYVEPKSSKKVQASRTLPYIPAILGALTLIATVVLNIAR